MTNEEQDHVISLRDIFIKRQAATFLSKIADGADISDIINGQSGTNYIELALNALNQAAPPIVTQPDNRWLVVGSLEHPVTIDRFDMSIDGNPYTFLVGPGEIPTVVGSPAGILEELPSPLNIPEGTPRELLIALLNAQPDSHHIQYYLRPPTPPFGGPKARRVRTG